MTIAMSRHPHQPDDTDSEESFFARWSQRKKQTQPGHSDPEEEQVQPDADNQNVQEPVKRDEDMPPLETIDGKSDVSEFFSPGVSETLRKAALRKLFHSPAFNIVDGLDDYDDDFTTFKALGDIVTADMRHQMELEKEREEARETESLDDSQMLEDAQEEVDASTLSDEESANAGESVTDAQDDHSPSDTDVMDKHEKPHDEGEHNA